MKLSLEAKPFTFKLTRSLQTAKGILRKKKGWLVKIKSSTSHVGWGEIAPIDSAEIEKCQNALQVLGSSPLRDNLEEAVRLGPGSLSFGIGSALAEIDELNNSGNRKWYLKAPESAILLPNGNACLSNLESVLTKNEVKTQTFKLKVAITSHNVEKDLISKIIERLPINSKLRLDANTGWSREEASFWANYFINEPRIEWLEQPLSIDDLQGLFALSEKIPIALDESLVKYPFLKQKWKCWQIRRPALEGDPRIILKELKEGANHLCISTAFETGIGRRCIHHLAALQHQTKTPNAPGLAPGWCPKGSLFSEDPELVWATV